jgi:hypothetical protein
MLNVEKSIKQEQALIASRRRKRHETHENECIMIWKAVSKD